MNKRIDFLNGCSLVFDGAALILVDSIGATCDIDGSISDICAIIALFMHNKNQRGKQ